MEWNVTKGILLAAIDVYAVGGSYTHHGRHCVADTDRVHDSKQARAQEWLFRHASTHG